MATRLHSRTGGQLTPSFVRASEIPERKSRLVTGYPALDNLIGEMEGGQTYLFCGYSGSPFVDELIHRLMVKASHRGKVAYLNSTDYYSEKTLISADRLAFYAKVEGLEASDVFNRIYFAAAYSDLRQSSATEALVQRTRREDQTVLAVAHRMPAFFENAADRPRARDCLNRALSALWRLSVERGLIMVITAASAITGRPIATSLTLALANVIVFFRESGMEKSKEVQATLIKHPAKRTPVTTCISEGGDDALGRITPPFRQNYQEIIEKLRKNYAAMLREAEGREAFELLLKDAWDKDHAAMSNSEIPLILDALNLTANIHNKSEVQRLKAELKERDKMIAGLEKRLDQLEAERHGQERQP